MSIYNIYDEIFYGMLVSALFVVQLLACIFGQISTTCQISVASLSLQLSPPISRIIQCWIHPCMCSLKGGFIKKCEFSHYRVFRKMHLKETLKMLPLALVLIKTKNRHLFDPLVKKCSFDFRIKSFQWLHTNFH